MFHFLNEASAIALSKRGWKPNPFTDKMSAFWIYVRMSTHIYLDGLIMLTRNSILQNEDIS